MNRNYSTIPQEWPPKWVQIIYAIIQWVDYHPIYLLPSRVRRWRYQLYDDYCLCENCQRRRATGLQPKGKR